MVEIILCVLILALQCYNYFCMCKSSNLVSTEINIFRHKLDDSFTYQFQKMDDKLEICTNLIDFMLKKEEKPKSGRKVAEKKKKIENT